MSASIRPPFPPALDSTMVGAFRSCPQKFRLEYLENWKPGDLSVHLHAGGAFARGLEVSRQAYYERGEPTDDALGQGLRALAEAYGGFECPQDSAKSLPRMLGALEFYFETWPLGRDPAVPATIAGRRAIEFSFAEPLPIAHPETGEPLIYAGRCDQIVNFAGGLWLEDDKTASQLGASWGRQWDLRSQFTGYAWAARQTNLPVTGVLVRGVSILKTTYGSAEHLTYRPPWQVDRWFTQLLHDIERMIAAWRSGYFDFNLDHACAEYGGCPFRSVCLLPDPSEWLTTYFERRTWDPILRVEHREAA